MTLKKLDKEEMKGKHGDYCASTPTQPKKENV
jgi:hypothetical protein